MGKQTLDTTGTVRGANPYLPLWEHIPDGEPRVFEHNGEERVYIYGSHDIERDKYCGKNYVVWSAPVDDLTDWKYHGVSYESHYDSLLYAPDVVKKGDTYYLYAAEKQGSVIVVATSKTPWGPFENPVETKLGFDPGILVDDDGRVYAYWGGCAAPCYIAELADDMVTIKQETLVENPLGHSICPWNPVDDGHIDLIDAFFEASSPRKVLGKYVYIFSRRYDVPVPELGVFEPCNGFLSYRISDSPFGPFREGGDISFNGGEILHDSEGVGTMTYHWSNNHGSVMEIGGQWYIFYHRRIGTNEYSRQAMIEPVDVALGKDGKLYIGDVRYLNGEPVSSRPVEMTSQGAQVNGLDAYQWISGGYACHIYGGSKEAYIEPVYEERGDISSPIVEITSGTTVGFRYLQFGLTSAKSVTVDRKGTGAVKINVRLDSYRGRILSTLDFSDEETEKTAPLCGGVIGKHAVYFEYLADDKEAAFTFDRFTFDRY
ncbi:MAG: family 43 glycosylhydrolase [Lachnospiraceae bacterium]|nr:family 43 glycosylhydrolase [Lachnospiraceae bacterium]